MEKQRLLNPQDRKIRELHSTQAPWAYHPVRYSLRNKTNIELGTF